MDRLNPTWQNKVQHLQKTLEANGISYRINGIDASDPTADIEFSDADDATSGCNQDVPTLCFMNIINDKSFNFLDFFFVDLHKIYIVISVHLDR